MQTFAELWWLWLLLAVGLGVYVGVNQVLRMKRMLDGKAFDGGFQKGLYGFVLGGMGASLFFVLFLVAIVWTLLNK